MKLPDERWQAIQFRSIALTGKFLNDLTTAERQRIEEHFTSEERLVVLDHALTVGEDAHDNSSQPEETDAQVVSQELIQKAMQGDQLFLAAEKIRGLLISGAPVEPGPLLAFLRRRVCKDEKRKRKWIGISVHFRVRPKTSPKSARHRKG